MRMANENIILSQVEATDINEIHSFTSNYNSITPFYSTKIRTREYWKQRFSLDGLWNDDYGMLKVIDRADNKLSGVTWFFKPPSVHSQLEFYEIAFNIFRTDKREKGFAAQILAMVSSYLFETYPIERVQSTTMLKLDHISIEKVAKASGFFYEGTMRKAIFIRGEHVDIQLFSLLREESPPLSSLISST